MSSRAGGGRFLGWHASQLGCRAIFPPSSALIFQRPPVLNSRFRPRSLRSAGPALAHPAGLSRLTSWPAPSKTQPNRRTGLSPLFAAFFGGLTIDRVGVSDHSGDGVARGAPPPWICWPPSASCCCDGPRHRRPRRCRPSARGMGPPSPLAQTSRARCVGPRWSAGGRDVHPSGHQLRFDPEAVGGAHQQVVGND